MSWKKKAKFKVEISCIKILDFFETLHEIHTNDHEIIISHPMQLNQRLWRFFVALIASSFTSVALTFSTSDEKRFTKKIFHPEEVFLTPYLEIYCVLCDSPTQILYYNWPLKDSIACNNFTKKSMLITGWIKSHNSRKHFSLSTF